MSDRDRDSRESAIEYGEVPDESEQLDQLQSEDSLLDRGVDDILDEGITTSEKWSVLGRGGGPQTLDQRLAAELPDGARTDDEGEDDFYKDEYVDDGEVGRRRAGRLVDPNQGIGEDDESQLVGGDVGIDGSAASAEEAAVHVIGDDDE